MDNKRKASGVNGLDSPVDTPDRSSKRRKLVEEFGDLSNGETPETTTGYGLSILETIRATTDKNGRSVSPFFETLPSRSEDRQYYKIIRLPLSLELIEQKLNDRLYPDLSSLESDFKRLVQNAKETNSRTSTIFGDAERVRKAVSNLMVKHNPAYKSGNYQAVATPLPPSPGSEEDEEEEDADAETAEEDGKAKSQNGDQEEAGEGEKESLKPQADRHADDEGEDQDANEDGDGDGDDDEEENEEDDEDDDDADDDGDVRVGRRSSRKARSPGSGQGGRGGRGGRRGRARRESTATSQRGSLRTGRTDNQYEDVPFQGLSFQQAQEKIVEEMIRKKDDTGDYPYFEPFIYLPPRSLKDYFEVIKEPLSLRALQKQVRGQRGRSEATHVSEFKGWGAFEDHTSLIWKNAFFYNEDRSEISEMAKELRDFFNELVKEAKQHAPEPPQPRIKLKVPQNSETPGNPKKITIHVGGKSNAADSPAPATGQSGEGAGTGSLTPVGRNPFTGSATPSVNVSQLEKARSMSASVGPASPAVMAIAKAEEPVRQSLILPPPQPATTMQQFAPPLMHTSNGIPNGFAPLPPPPPPPPPPRQTVTDILEAQKYRPRVIKESEALMPKLMITSHPSLPNDNRLSISIPTSPTEAQQDVMINIPSNHRLLQLRPYVASFLQAQEREWRMTVLHDFMPILPTAAIPYEKKEEPVFDVQPNFKNRFEVTLVAALPKGQKADNGLSMEMERFTVYLNVLRHA